MNKYSLLVVDDEEIARRHILEDVAWETLDVGPLYEADGGRAALDSLARFRPDIVILDIKMPELDGMQLLDLIVERRYEPQIITLSGYSDFEAARKMLSSGIVVEYLLKPASEDELFEAVYKCIERIDERRGAGEPPRLETGEGEVPDPASLPGDRPRGAKAAMVRQVKEYLQANYADHVTLDSAARTVFVNPTYLSKVFSEVEGVGFSDYLAQLRIARAKEALMDCHKRIYEVSEAVGYQNVKHFMKVFKKQAGMTPSEYREQNLF